MLITRWLKAILWRNRDRFDRLERRVSALERRPRVRLAKAKAPKAPAVEAAAPTPLDTELLERKPRWGS